MTTKTTKTTKQQGELTMSDTHAGAALDASTVRAMVASNADTLVVDVRTPGEFETAHIDGAINIPLDQVDAHLRRIVTDAGGTLVLVCQSGGRAQQAASKLASAGLHDIVIMTGGMTAWVAAGGPVESTGWERWALERQVRLVAGALVFFSVVVSLWIPLAVILAGGVGAGLAIAALTNTCVMGMLLTRLPYNRGAACDIDAAIARLSR